MHTLSLTGVGFFCVGAVLWINGLSLLDLIDRKETVWINFFGGVINFLVATSFAFSPTATPLTIRSGTWLYLFSCTYLWNSWNRVFQRTDERGLGWFCLFVTLTSLPITWMSWPTAHSLWEIWYTLCWGLWAILWFFLFLKFSLGWGNQRKIGWLTLCTGLISAWLPGYLLLWELIR